MKMLYEVYSLLPFLELADIDNSSQRHLNIPGFASKTLQIDHNPENQSRVWESTKAQPVV